MALMENLMPAPSSGSVHWVRKPGYIKGGLHEPVCGIADKVNAFTSVNEPQYQFRVTCEHCLYWLWEQEQPARKMDIDNRVLNMEFRNRGLSAHDTEMAIQRGTEQAIQRGIREGLAKVASDFRATKPELERMVADGVQAALQRSSVRTNLVGIHKIAVDEIDAEYEGSEEQEKDDREWERDVKQALTDVLDDREQSGAGVGTTVEFTQNVYSPAALTPEQIWRRDFHGETSTPGTTVVNVNAEVDPESFKDMVKEAAREYDEETVEQYDAEETVLMQKAVTSIVTSDEFQGLMKRVVKVALDEREQDAHKRALEWQIAWSERYSSMYPLLSIPGDPIEGSDHNASKIGIELKGPDSYVHYRRLYRADTACLLDANKFNTTQLKSRVTCQDCKDELNN